MLQNIYDMIKTLIKDNTTNNNNECQKHTTKRTTSILQSNNQSIILIQKSIKLTDFFSIFVSIVKCF
jgi:hypothetical protein